MFEFERECLVAGSLAHRTAQDHGYDLADCQQEARLVLLTRPANLDCDIVIWLKHRVIDRLCRGRGTRGSRRVYYFVPPALVAPPDRSVAEKIAELVADCPCSLARRYLQAWVLDRQSIPEIQARYGWSLNVFRVARNFSKRYLESCTTNGSLS